MFSLEGDKMAIPTFPLVKHMKNTEAVIFVFNSTCISDNPMQSISQ